MHHIKSKTTFMLFMTLVLTMFIFVSSENSWAGAEHFEPVNVVASGSFDQTVDKVKTLVAKNDMMVMGEINQGKMLSMTGLKLNGVTLLIGNPMVGKKLFSADPAVGLSVPIRIYIFSAKDGKTIISYYKPSEVLAQHHNPAIDKVGSMLDAKLEKLTSMAAR